MITMMVQGISLTLRVSYNYGLAGKDSQLFLFSLEFYDYQLIAICPDVLNVICHNYKMSGVEE